MQCLVGKIMRAKYVEETFKKWMMFGVAKDGAVDVSDGDGDVLTGIKKSEAENIIKERDKIVDALIEAIGDDYEKFVKLREDYEK
jgi:hypothetical protein